jgi:hypothetical protein
MNYTQGISGTEIQQASLKLQRTQLALSVISVALIAYSVLVVSQRK